MSPGISAKEIGTIAIDKTKNNRKNKGLIENKRVSLNIFEFLYLKLKNFCGNKTSCKENFFLLSEERFKCETDIVYILEKIQPFEKFKMVLLNEKQLRLFNLMSKPFIYLEKQQEKQHLNKRNLIFSKFLTMDPADSKKRIEELKNYYHQL